MVKYKRYDFRVLTIPMHNISFRRNSSDRPSSIKRFWAKARKSNEDGCWEWSGHLNPYGYGRTKYWLGDRVERFAHRIAYFFATGIDPDGKIVRHSCDNRKCVNPKHLILGTQADNIADKVARDRQCKGSAHPCAKLTEEKVKDIKWRLFRGVSMSSLAREHNVSTALIRKIKIGQDWRHVTI